jgi:nicotinate-nucleotide adenylyltransferase
MTGRPGRLGVLGGSFDPVHRGHLYIALLAREAAGLDRVLLVPAAQPPHKRGDRLTPVAHRVRMLEIAVRGEEGLDVSDVELRPGASTYTVDTLRTLAAENPGLELHFVLGTDSLHDFPRWRSPERILETHRLIAVDRPGVEPPVLEAATAARCRLVTGNPFGIAATLVRERCSRGLPIRHLVPGPVADYIAAHRIYSGESD